MRSSGPLHQIDNRKYQSNYNQNSNDYSHFLLLSYVLLAKYIITNTKATTTKTPITNSIFLFLSHVWFAKYVSKTFNAMPAPHQVQLYALSPQFLPCFSLPSFSSLSFRGWDGCGLTASRDCGRDCCCTLRCCGSACRGCGCTLRCGCRTSLFRCR